MDKIAAEIAATGMADEFLMNITKLKGKKKEDIKGGLRQLVVEHMKRTITRYLDLLRSQSSGEFSVETDKGVILDMKLGTAIKIISNNLEYVGYVEEINIQKKNKHLVH